MWRGGADTGNDPDRRGINDTACPGYAALQCADRIVRLMPLDRYTAERHVVRGACPHDCPDTCALHVTVENGRAVDIAGDPDHPTTRGTLCTKVARYLERTYSSFVRRLASVSRLPIGEESLPSEEPLPLS